MDDTFSVPIASEIVEPSQEIIIIIIMYHTQKSTARTIAEIIAGTLAIIMVVDALGFMAWVVSGQHPVDGFYIGALTANVLKLFI